MSPSLLGSMTRHRVVPDVATFRGPVAFGDASRIAFRRADVPHRPDVWVADEGRARRVARASNDARPYDLMLSPDGRHLAVRTTGPRGRGVCIVAVSEDLDQTERPLAPRPAQACAWRPDGSALICFDGRTGRLFELDPEGHELDIASLDDDADPLLVPTLAVSASTIAVVTHRASQGCASIWLVNDHGPSLLSDVPGAQARVWPMWSDDGRDLALHVVHPTCGRSAIIVHHDQKGGGTVIHAADLIDATTRPAWSPTGEHIAFFRTVEEGVRHTRSAPPVLTLVDVDSGDLTTLGTPTDAAGNLRFVDAKRLVVEAQDGAHLLTFDQPL